MTGGSLCTCSANTAVCPVVSSAEQLLCALLAKPELIDEIPGLEPHDFPAIKQQIVFSAMRNLQHRGEVIAVKTIHDYLCALDEVRGTVCRLHGGQMYMRALLRVDPTPNAARDAAHVRGWAAVLRRERYEREVVPTGRTSTEAKP